MIFYSNYKLILWNPNRNRKLKTDYFKSVAHKQIPVSVSLNIIGHNLEQSRPLVNKLTLDSSCWPTFCQLFAVSRPGTVMMVGLHKWHRQTPIAFAGGGVFARGCLECDVCWRHTAGSWEQTHARQWDQWLWRKLIKIYKLQMGLLEQCSM